MTLYVYIIGSPVVKIGSTTDLATRLAALQASSPVKLAILWAEEVPATGIRSGSADVSAERYLHRAFAENRLNGEWFDLDGDAIGKVHAALARYLGGDALPGLPPRSARPAPVPAWYSDQAIEAVTYDVAELFRQTGRERMFVEEIKAWLYEQPGVYSSISSRQLSKLLSMAFGTTSAMTINGKRTRGFTRHVINRRAKS